MNKEDILSINDWIKISIKFSGICMNCKKRLSSGEYGYWSRTSKSILHESCYNSLFLSSFDIRELNDGGSSREGVGGKNNSKAVIMGGNVQTAVTNVVSNINSNSIIKKREKKIKCFICDKYIDFNNDLIISLLNLSEKYDGNSGFFYCYDCLENFNDAIRDKYKKKFMSQF